MPSRCAHLPSLTMECISTARLASVSIMNSACSATDGELAVPATISGMLRRPRAGTSAAAEAAPDSGPHLHLPGRLELRLAEPGAAERHAVNRRLRLEHGLEIRCGNHIG